MKNNYYVYFLTNHYNNVLYVGITNDILRRIAEHKSKINKGFTYKYNCDKLVYYEVYTSVNDAIEREKQLKNWKREWKNKLINDFNPVWKDLSEDIGVNEGFIEAVKEEYNRNKNETLLGESRIILRANTDSSVVHKHSKEIAGQARNDRTLIINN